ncbi:MAG: FG-GAP repeat protein [Planctomycetes bacterium]|nr:FG-GAP repeat protein [Planctomycetota bacterium]
MEASDWSGIRAAYVARRDAAYPAEGGYRLYNTGQHWSTQFDGRGFLTKPDRGDWSWGLELKGYGSPGREKAAPNFTKLAAEGVRVNRVWDENLTEWYQNDVRGLEHGYTIRERPGDVEGLLSFTLAVRGDLRPQVLANGRDVRFVNNNKTSVLDYSGVTVIDAVGKNLPARFENLNGNLQLTVDERGARYPLTIDPVAQQAYLKASNAEAGDYFGNSVSVSGNTVVVAAYQETSSATGVNGDQSNNGSFFAGAVYVFVRSGTTWSQQAYLKASNTDAGDQFGYSVSISGDTVVVGAPGESSYATGVNNDQYNNSATNSGAAYVFVRSGTTWSQQAYLKASNTGTSDRFGLSVSVTGDTIAVGAPYESSHATGVDGDQSDNSTLSSGAAYVFVRSGTTWSQQAYLKASNTYVNYHFGYSVSGSGDTVAVGSYGDSSNATGVNGDQTNKSSPNSGAAYVFVRVGTAWSQQAYLKASNTGQNDYFALSVSASGDTVVVGAYAEDSNATGVNGNQSDNSISYAGAAYVFVRNGTAWSQQAYLKPSNTPWLAGGGGAFGISVSVSGDTVVVGAEGESSSATGVNGNQNNNSAPSSGAAYVFKRSGSTWAQQAYLKASNTNAADDFGLAVAVSGDIVVVGAYSEASNATGVNGNQGDNSAAHSGAAYVFDIDNNPGTVSYGTGTAGCAGTETLDVTHAPMINSPHFAITCNNAPPFSLGLGIVTNSQDLAGSDPFSLGILLHVDFAFATEVYSFDFNSDGTGYAQTAASPIPNDPTLIGRTFFACAVWVWTSCTLPGFNVYNMSSSRGLAITIQAP